MNDIIMPTKQEMKELIKIAACLDDFHVLNTQNTIGLRLLIQDKIKCWYIMNNEQRHKTYCRNPECCYDPSKSRSTFEDHEDLTYMINQVSQYSVVILKDKGYEPYSIQQFETNSINPRFTALPRTVLYEQGDLPTHEWFTYDDIILALWNLPTAANDIDKYMKYRNDFKQTIDMLTIL